jgi:ketosteroid isomerase-like protein
VAAQVPRPFLFLAAWPIHACAAGEDEAIFQTEREICVAYLKGDVDAIARNVMEDYTVTNSRGEITGRDQDIDDAKKRDPKYEIFENHEMKVRVHGSTAVVTGRTHLKGISGGKLFDSEIQFTDTLIKDKGRWRLLAVHASNLPKKTP